MVLAHKHMQQIYQNILTMVVPPLRFSWQGPEIVCLKTKSMHNEVWGYLEI